MSYKIGFAGTDGRTFLSAVIVSTATSEKSKDEFEGVVIRGTSGMRKIAQWKNWQVKFVSTPDNSLESFTGAIVEEFKKGNLDYVMVMPEDLLYQGLVDRIMEAGFGEKIIGLTKKGSLLVEGDKIACKRLCKEYHIPVADEWFEVEARDFEEFRDKVLYLIDKYGGAVLKYPYSAGGKGSRFILDPWNLKIVYADFMKNYAPKYLAVCGKDHWPLLIESLMSGFEVSFTTFVDKNGNFQVLPTSMDYPTRFEGPPSLENPITGGMGSISPHPIECKELIEMAKKEIFEPFVKALKEKKVLRPCVLYPGCIVSVDGFGKPKRIRMCEMNIRPGDPEFQVVARRVRNLGQLIKAMCDGNLNEIEPEVRKDQISITVALVVGPGGPEGQKGYPWSYTKGERVEIDFKYFEERERKKKKIWLIPAGLSFDEKNGIFKTDGGRVIYLSMNGQIKPGQKISEVAERLRQEILNAFNEGKIRAIPRENPEGNRLDLRRDIGIHYQVFEEIFKI
jgi:phosphoribosylamine--glycine ligase